MIVCNAVSPCHNALVSGISNAIQSVESYVEMAKRKDPKQKTINKIIANVNVTADSIKHWWAKKRARL